MGLHVELWFMSNIAKNAPPPVPTPMLFINHAYFFILITSIANIIKSDIHTFLLPYFYRRKQAANCQKLCLICEISEYD